MGTQRHRNAIPQRWGLGKQRTWDRVRAKGMGTLELRHGTQGHGDIRDTRTQCVERYKMLDMDAQTQRTLTWDKRTLDIG